MNRIRRTLLVGAAGFAVQAAVAWGFAAKFVPSEHRGRVKNVIISSIDPATGDVEHFWTRYIEVFGADRFALQNPRSRIDKNDLKSLAHRYEAIIINKPYEITAAAADTDARIPSSGTHLSAACYDIVDRYGWPMYSMYSAFTVVEFNDPISGNYRTAVSRSLLRLDPPHDVAVPFDIVDNVRFIPLRINPAATLCNTILYSLALMCCWNIVLFPQVLVRRRRARIGLCGMCGYDMRQIRSPVCPECGQSRKSLSSRP